MSIRFVIVYCDLYFHMHIYDNDKYMHIDVWSLKAIGTLISFYFLFFCFWYNSCCTDPVFVLLWLFSANMYTIKGYIHILVSLPFVGIYFIWYFVQCTVDISLQMKFCWIEIEIELNKLCNLCGGLWWCSESMWVRSKTNSADIEDKLE